MHLENTGAEPARNWHAADLQELFVGWTFSDERHHPAHAAFDFAANVPVVGTNVFALAVPSAAAEHVAAGEFHRMSNGHSVP